MSFEAWTIFVLFRAVFVTTPRPNAKTPVRADERPAKHIYIHALAVATINPKSIAGYLAAFTQFVLPDWTETGKYIFVADKGDYSDIIDDLHQRGQ